MTIKKSFSISIVTFRSNLSELRSTIASLLGELKDLKNSYSMKLYLVDNFSGNEYRYQITKLIEETCAKSWFQNIELIPLDANIGFGAAHNQAIFSSTANYHMILNPDIFFESGALGHGLKQLDDNAQLGLVAPAILDDERKITRTHCHQLTFSDVLLRSLAPGFIKDAMKKRLDHISAVPENVVIASQSKVFFSGCVMLCRRQALLDIGGFDSRFFLYFEDYDLSKRLLLHHNAIVDSKFIVLHAGGKTIGKGPRHWAYFFSSYLKFFFTSRD